jgi:hypothetical protein
MIRVKDRTPRMTSAEYVTDAQYVDGYRIRLAFNDGVNAIVDLKHELYGPKFGELVDIDLFKQVKLEPELSTIVWPNGADIAPDILYELAIQSIAAAKAA